MDTIPLDLNFIFLNFFMSHMLFLFPQDSWGFLPPFVLLFFPIRISPKSLLIVHQSLRVRATQAVPSLWADQAGTQFCWRSPIFSNWAFSPRLASFPREEFFNFSPRGRVVVRVEHCLNPVANIVANWRKRVRGPVSMWTSYNLSCTTAS